MGADPVPSVQAQVRRQQGLDAVCAATLRALSARREVHTRGSHWYAGDTALPSFAPHLHPQAQCNPQSDEPARPLAPSGAALAPLSESAKLLSFRGAADGIALRLLKQHLFALKTRNALGSQ